MSNANVKNEAGAEFEKKMEALRGIVERLENGADISLEESMKLFEEGLNITQDCVSTLNDFQTRIAELNGRLDIILRQATYGADDE